MRCYKIPNTDNVSTITKNLKFNYQRYRTLLHFIYLNKDSYTIDDKEVKAAGKWITNKSGKVVCGTANLQFNSNRWNETWNEISKDNIFIYHVKKMFHVPDILEYLSESVLPSGITRLMQGIMAFVESLKKCHEELSKEIDTEKSPPKVKEDYDMINDWLTSIEKEGPENFIIPDEIYELAKKFAEDQTLDFATCMDCYFQQSTAAWSLRPYIWATIIEEFSGRDIHQLPVYKPPVALGGKIENQQDKSSRAETYAECKKRISDSDELSSDSKEKYNHRIKRMKRSLNATYENMAAEQGPKAVISFPLIAGMEAEDLRLQINLQFFSIKRNSALFFQQTSDRNIYR